MNKFRILVLFLILFLFVSVCLPVMGSAADSDTHLVLPLKSSERSDMLALDLLDLGSAASAQEFANLCGEAGFDVLLQEHFDKSKEDPSHNCAFTISKGRVLRGDAECPALLVTIRGTTGGEWFSNFDFCPSHTDPPVAAENFLFCAEDVFLSLEGLLAEMDPGTVVIITGISRGAACANLLGLLVNDYIAADSEYEGFEIEDVYVYTFACPNVLGVNQDLAEPDNIFNYVNPADLIPKVPLAQWGFTRVGTDVILPQKDEFLTDMSESYVQMIYEIAPSITDYYTERHSLTGPGDDPFGLTSFELMLLLSKRMIEESDKIIYEDGNLVWQGSNTPSSSLLDSFRESDFAGLIHVLDPMLQEQNGQALKLLLQHMPFCYRELMQQMIAQ